MSTNMSVFNHIRFAIIDFLVGNATFCKNAGFKTDLIARPLSYIGSCTFYNGAKIDVNGKKIDPNTFQEITITHPPEIEDV